MLYNLVTGLIMVLVIRSGVLLIGGRLPRRAPWVAIALTALVVAGLILQHTWSGALAALENDPARSGWWRPITAAGFAFGAAVWLALHRRVAFNRDLTSSGPEAT